MRSKLTKLAIAATAAAVVSLIAGVAPAVAGPTVLTGAKNSLASVGSDTSYFMMQDITQGYNVNNVQNTDLHDYVTQVPPLNNAPFPAGTWVPADAITGGKLWNSTTTASTPPNGSSAGISALDADTTGAIDLSRSSRGPNTGETSTHDFWAYALGALDYVTFGATHAPAAGLTQTQLINIYTCFASGPNVGKPIVSNWSQVGGANGTIVKYLPQAGSGTLSFFQSKLLNGNTADANCDSAHKSISLEEHDARGVTLASKPNAIYAFDWSKWNAQFKQFEADLRNGATLGKINGVLPTPTTVKEGSGHFLGTRYIFNVVRKANHPSSYANQYTDVLKFIGVRPNASGGAGFICIGGARSAITLAGFVPLPGAATGGTGLPNSQCRLNPAPL